jgi:hypothetical protein
LREALLGEELGRRLQDALTCFWGRFGGHNRLI